MKLLILPLEVSSANKLRAVYCQEDNTPIQLEVDYNLDSSIFSAINRMYTGLGITEIDHTKVFKLGKIDDLYCYAVDVSELKQNPHLNRAAFHKIMEGDYTDSKLLAACFLAISYFA